VDLTGKGLGLIASNLVKRPFFHAIGPFCQGETEEIRAEISGGLQLVLPKNLIYRAGKRNQRLSPLIEMTIW
jgi:hypothetical protein